MNINYDEIITKANTRKNQLQKLTELLKQQPEMLEALRNVREWSLMVSDCWAGIDEEGRSLLPPGVQAGLSSRLVTILRIEQAINTDDSGIVKWVE